jgi:hypothetical protein
MAATQLLITPAVVHRGRSGSRRGTQGGWTPWVGRQLWRAPSFEAQAHARSPPCPVDGAPLASPSPPAIHRTTAPSQPSAGNPRNLFASAVPPRGDNPQVRNPALANDTRSLPPLRDKEKEQSSCVDDGSQPTTPGSLRNSLDNSRACGHSRWTEAILARATCHGGEDGAVASRCRTHHPLRVLAQALPELLQVALDGV